VHWSTPQQENNDALQQNATLNQQDSMMLSLRQSITDERVDVKNIFSQLHLFFPLGGLARASDRF
jgi:hypothetical protein